MAGLFAGALLTGPIADRYGRRRIFAYNMAILGALSVLQAFIDSRGQLLALRLAIGFLVGTDYVVNKALLTEFAPRRIRGRILGSLSVARVAAMACESRLYRGRSSSGAGHVSLLGGAIIGLIIVDRISRRSFLIGSFRWAPETGTRNAGLGTLDRLAPASPRTCTD